MSTRRPRGPLSVGCATGSVVVTIPTGRASVVRRAASAVAAGYAAPSRRLGSSHHHVRVFGCGQPASGRTRTASRRSKADRRQRTSGGRPLHRSPPRDRLSGRPPSSSPPTVMSLRASNRSVSDRGHGGRRGASWHRRPVAAAPSPCATYPATAEAVGAARRQVVRIAREDGACRRALDDIELAVSEALTNAILHAYASAGTRGEAFSISTAAKGALFSVWVTDEGQGGTSSVPSPGLGLGLELMDRLCRRVEIGVLEDGRTQVEMRFDLGVAASS
jgi:serine/threonine-protein kinase RsbW